LFKGVKVVLESLDYQSSNQTIYMYLVKSKHVAVYGRLKRVQVIQVFQLKNQSGNSGEEEKRGKEE